MRLEWAFFYSNIFLSKQKIFQKPPLIRSPSYKPPTLQVIGTCKRKSIHPILYAALAPRDLRPIQIMTFSVQLNEKKKRILIQSQIQTLR